jgi:hypothetical protein
MAAFGGAKYVAASRQSAAIQKVKIAAFSQKPLPVIQVIKFRAFLSVVLVQFPILGRNSVFSDLPSAAPLANTT